MAVSVVGLLLLILIGLAAFFIVRFLVRRLGAGQGHAGVAVVAVLGAGLLALFLLVILTRVSVPRASHPAWVQHGVPPATTTSPGAVWTPALEEEYGWKASIHPSVQRAAEVLGRKVSHALLAAHGTQRPVMLQADAAVDAELVESLGAALKAADGIEVTGEEIFEEGKPLPVRVTVRHDAEPAGPTAPWGANEPIRSGTLHAVVDDGGLQLVERAAYIEKPWVDQFAAFVNRFPQRGYLQARSGMAQTSALNAAVDARQGAAGQLLDMILLKAHGRLDALPREVMVQMIAGQLAHRDEVVDEFTQSLDGRHGTVWRHALLVAPTESLLHDLERNLRGVTTTTQVRTYMPWATIILMFLVILAVYAVANAATRGYYTLVLRGVTVVVVVGLVGFVLLTFS